MLKKILFLTFIFSLSATAEVAPSPDFEAELRALETNQLKTEELQMRNVDAVSGIFDGSDTVTDDVSTGQAAPLKADSAPTLEAKKESEASIKSRRIRAR